MSKVNTSNTAKILLNDWIQERRNLIFFNNRYFDGRDIAYIFLDTGLGPRSYSIIEQGMVNRVIDAKPEELRTCSEELGGASKYKERRRKTENRMLHTCEKFYRLKYLIDEIENQLTRLDRQCFQDFEQQRDGEQGVLNQLQLQSSDVGNQLTLCKIRVAQVYTRHQQLEKELLELDKLQLKDNAELETNIEKRNALFIQIEQMAEQNADLFIQKEDYQQTLNSSRNRLKKS